MLVYLVEACCRSKPTAPWTIRQGDRQEARGVLRVEQPAQVLEQPAQVLEQPVHAQQEHLSNRGNMRHGLLEDVLCTSMHEFATVSLKGSMSLFHFISSTPESPRPHDHEANESKQDENCENGKNRFMSNPSPFVACGLNFIARARCALIATSGFEFGFQIHQRFSRATFSSAVASSIAIQHQRCRQPSPPHTIRARHRPCRRVLKLFGFIT